MSGVMVVGLLTRTFECDECGVSARLTVHVDGPHDPGVMDRFRLLAASSGWVIDLDGRPWCERHRGRAAGTGTGPGDVVRRRAGRAARS